MHLLKPILLLLCSAFLCGCPPLRGPGVEKATPERVFLQSFEMSPSKQLESLRDLQKNSETPWSLPAGRMVELMEKRQELSRRIEALERSGQECDNERRQLMDENRQLEEERARLFQDLEKLKSLVIEMEMRSHRSFSPSPVLPER